MRAYRALLHLYPRSFRMEYGDELCAIFAGQRRGAIGAGARLRLWGDEVIDVVSNAALVHADLLAQDLRHAARSLARARAFTVTAILVAALGIGATSAAFSMADHVLLRPLPFRDSDRLVQLWQDQSFRGYPRMEQSPANFLDWRRLATSFEAMAAYTSQAANLVAQGEPERLEGAVVSVETFGLLGIQAALGRALASVDARDDSEAAVVLSNALWRTTFGGDPAVVGRRIVLDDEPHVVVGVMPAGFDFPRRSVEYWTALRFPPDALRDRSDTFLNVIARLKAGVSIEQARGEMQLIAAELARAYPRENGQTGATIVHLRDQISAQSRTLVAGLAGASACMLLIACSNLANLLLARGLTRRKELAVRAAMGAGRDRLIRQTLTEALVLAALGGVAGVGLAIAALPLVARLVPTGLPIADVPAVDARMLGVAAVVTLMTGIGMGILPAIRATRGTEADALREDARTGSGRGTERIRSGLVVATVAGTLVLLASAGLLVRALWRVQQIDPGFRAANVLTLQTVLSSSGYEATAARQQFYDRVIAEVEALPGVTRAAYISFLPMGRMRGGIWPVILDASRLSPQARESWAPDPTETRMAHFRMVTPGFFETLGIPLRRGRDVSAADTLTSPAAAVVSESFVDQMWPGQDPIGRQFFIAFRERTVVGVVGTIRVRGLERESEPQVYIPSGQVPDRALLFYAPKDLVVAGTVPMATLAPAIREAVARIDPRQPVTNVLLLEDVVEGETGARRTQVRVLAGFAAVSFVLAGVGIHGLLAFAVSSRTREIGVRIALGADSRQIVGMVLRRAAILASAGTAIGIALAVGAGRALQSVLAGVSPTDAPVFAAAIGLSGVMALVGCLLPALRASRVDPVAAIRGD